MLLLVLLLLPLLLLLCKPLHDLLGQFLAGICVPHTQDHSGAMLCTQAATAGETAATMTQQTQLELACGSQSNNAQTLRWVPQQAGCNTALVAGLLLFSYCKYTCCCWYCSRQLASAMTSWQLLL